MATKSVVRYLLIDSAFLRKECTSDHLLTVLNSVQIICHSMYSLFQHQKLKPL
jgi:hypothetical protein